MLKTRVITALLLLAVILPGLFFLPQRDWAILCAAFVAIGAWEWGGFLGWREPGKRALGAAFFLLCGALVFGLPCLLEAQAACLPSWVIPVYGLSALFWALLVPFWLKRKWALGQGAAGLLVGGILLFPTWLALVQLRTLGPEVLLVLLAVVWVADIAAYFAGRRFGRHKLAPTVSPGKTWEGACGAVLGVVLYGFAWRSFLGLADFSLLLLPALLLLTAISIIGDLFESLLKRQAGIKDSSQVLPGHGGVLDRIDSLTSTMPLLALLWLLFRA